MPTTLFDLPNYEVHSLLYESTTSLIYQGKRQNDEQAVVIKIQKQAFPTPEELAYYQQEFNITKKVSANGVIKVYDLQKYQNKFFIVLEDIDGCSLKQLLNQNCSFSIKTFLNLAIDITQALAEIHAQNIIHKDINPSNIIWNQETNQIRIIDFSISSLLPRETTQLKNPNQLEGTLDYISPEQTGRMNCSLDYRTDLYSLGITFYEMLTQQLPFHSEDPMELVHCHIAKPIEPPHQLNNDIPPILCHIIQKLTAKNAQQRYQSAMGLHHDLKICLDNLDNLTQLNFPLAQQDYSGRFHIPQKLYGRDAEIALLLQSFDRVTQGATEMILVAGYSGVGKSALVNAVHLPMTKKNGYFAAGKFDQYQRNTPYSAISQAFEDFCHYLLTESTERLEKWKCDILNAVGENGQVLIDVIPALEYIIGEQAEVAKLDAQAAQNRFNTVFKNFMQVICHEQNPLVLFIDDWQWADSASLNLLSLLLNNANLKYLLVIGAYRSNEVDETHPFHITITELQKNQADIYTVQLGNLKQQDVANLISDTLHHSQLAIQDLTQLIYEKTLGNAFFVNTFLRTLYEEELLNFNVIQSCWQWDVDKISQKSLADNVVDLMSGKIRKLADDTQLVLQLAASIGNKFNLHTLALIFNQSLTTTYHALWSAISEGLIIPLNDNYKLLEDSAHAGKALFKFQHDRIQQAAYALIATEQKQVLHLKIGRLLLEYSNREEKIFDIIQQLNHGINLVDDDNEKITIAKLNLQAGQRAIDEAAYSAALEYLQAARRLTRVKMWQTQYNLMLDIYIFSAKASLLVSDYDLFAELRAVVLQYAKTDLDKVRIYEFELLSYAVKNQIKDAVDVGHKVLAMLGLSLRETPPEQQNPDVYEQLPDMTDPASLFMYRIMVSIYVPSFHVDPKLGMQNAFTMLQLLHDKGNSPLSAYIYAFYGVLRIGIHLDIDIGYQFGQMALRLLEKYQAREIKCKVFTAYNAQIKPWKDPFKTAIAPLKQTIQIGLETGDLEFTGYASMHYCSALFLAGKPLKEICNESSIYIKMARNHKHPFPEFYLGLWGQLAENLTGQVENVLVLKGNMIDEIQHVDNPLFNIPPIKFTALLSKTIIHYLFEHYESAIEFAEQMEQNGKALVGVVSPSQGFYFYSLVALAVYPNAEPLQQQTYLETIKRYQQRLATWAQAAPHNFQHKYDLVAAELARVLGEYWQATELYEQAIQGAKQNDFVHDEALANELAGRFYHQRGMEKIAQVYIRDAHYHYIQWGAEAKAEQLKNKYAAYFVELMLSNSSAITTNKTIHSVTPATRQSSSDFLDLNTILQASQILSGEIKLDKLLTAMMSIVIRNAGADKGFLLLPKQKNWFIEAEALLDAKEIKVMQSIDIEKNILLANKIVNFVIRRKKSVLWPDRAKRGDFENDLYFQYAQPKSILCMPLLNRGELVAVLYLENRNTKHAFTENHIETLRLLSSQITISIENALFYAELENKVEQRTVELKAKNVVLEDLNREKNAMLGITAHDLKNPIGIIRGYAEMIEEEFDVMEQDEILDSIDKIKITANQMLDLIKNLLDMSALESGKFNINVEQQDILIPFLELFTIYQKRGLEKNIIVHNQSTETQCLAYVDSTAIRQILDNLISNAVKYSPPERNVFLYMDNIFDKQIVRFEVKDEGPGLSLEDQSKLFGKFAKLTPKPTGQEHSTGLGLFSVKKLIEQMGGSIRCESELGKGCSFIAEFSMQKLS